MKKINLHLKEYKALPLEEQQKIIPPFVTLDGYIFDNHYSYDNDYDQTLPSILTGVKNPSSVERMNNIRLRRSFPRSLLSIRKRKWTEWYQGNNYLSEILSKYPQLSAGLIVGKKTSHELVSILLTLNWKYNPQKDFPLYEDFLYICENRCRANNYQGKWKLLSKLLQVVSSKVALLGYIRENIHKRELYGNYIPLGQRLIESLEIVVSLYPVNPAQRKRGYKDKGSQKALHEIHDLSISSSTRRLTRTNLLNSPNESIVQFLYGVSNPVWIGDESESESEYRKTINRQSNQLRKREKEYIKSHTSKVKTYTLSADDLEKYK